MLSIRNLQVTVDDKPIIQGLNLEIGAGDNSLAFFQAFFYNVEITSSRSESNFSSFECWLVCIRNFDINNCSCTCNKRSSSRDDKRFLHVVHIIAYITK